ncbi:hypothetical protein K449DRAFT_393809 [Hypoxylon sp. EC38]|nr:hypothetical protein K449DRAFT_393809 [Hypoxylon sp. EC38]
MEYPRLYLNIPPHKIVLQNINTGMQRFSRSRNIPTNCRCFSEFCNTAIMSQLQGNKGLSSAWVDVERQIDEVLMDTMEKNRVNIVAVTSQPGAETPSLLSHIWQRAKEGKAPASLVYMVPSDTEALLVSQLLRESESLVEEDIGEGIVGLDTPIMIISFRDYVRELKKITWDSNRTIVVDVNWYSTVADEIALGHLISWAQSLTEQMDASGTKGHVAIILLMSAFESKRTVEAISKHLGRITRLECTEIQAPSVNIEIMKSGWQANVEGILEIFYQQGRRVVLATDAWANWDGLSSDRFHDRIKSIPSSASSRLEKRAAELDILKKASVVAVDPELPYSARIENLSLVLSDGIARKRRVLIPNIMQVVVKDRDLLWYEIMRHRSWALKSARLETPTPTQIRFLSPIGEDELRKRGESRENLGPAWNGDFMFMVLASIHSWPDRHVNQMPMRSPANHYLYVEAVRRLLVLGCIKESTKVEWTYECTDLGENIMRRYWDRDVLECDFQVVFLLARISLKRQENAEVLRVLVRIAALVRLGLDKLYWVEGHTDIDMLRRCCPPLIRDRAHAGAVWIGLSLFLLWEERDQRGSDIEESHWSHEGFCVDCESARSVKGAVAQLESELGLNSIKPETWTSQPLTEQQLLSIDRDMMWAWLHRIASFSAQGNPSRIEKPADCVSWADLTVNMKNEVIQEGPIRKYCNKLTEGRGAFFAFYLSLFEDAKGQLRASQMTWLPPEAFQEIPEKSGLQWPDAAEKTV